MPAPVTDTIAAVATPPGHGGVGVVRVSGPMVPEIARAVLGCLPEPRRARHCRFTGAGGEALDEGIALYFPAPHSYTGEHVLELQGHGGPVVLDLLLQRVLALGARPARPGEFTERAFLNSKLDLAQAEAVADLIEASSAAAARSALRSLEGEFSRQVEAVRSTLVELRVQVEAGLDFPDEELDLLADESLLSRLETLEARLAELLAKARQGALLREGMTVVIVGQPNVGKSSLLNRLAGRESAIVTDVPGTTRDVLRERILLDGLALHLVDTAGLRESADPVEREGIRRAWREVEAADLVLLLVDGTRGPGEAEHAILRRLPDRLPRLTVHNKIDLTPHAYGMVDGEIYLSAKTGAGIDALVQALTRQVGYHPGEEGVFMARRRHLDALAETARALSRAREQWLEARAGELVAEELRQAQEALGRITGRYTADDLLGEIFSSFCIGK